MPGLLGTRLGRYRLQQRLGQGGMSDVYLAYDELMHREIAIKVMSSAHTDYIERFHREAEAIGNLHHNHILPAFDYGEQEPWHYLVMPYIDHESLSDVLDRGPLTLEHAGELLTQIASALQYAHEHGILHRDIKPSNILLSDDHYAYLADFGLAKALDGSGSVTHTGVLLGTPEYMAPELADGVASTSSDLYALGILLYQMVTGHLPFTGDTPLAVYLRQMREQPVSPSRLNPAISQDVERVILRALDKDPRRRFQTPNDLAQAYQQALDATMSRRDGAVSKSPTSQVGLALSYSDEMPPLFNNRSNNEDLLGQAHGLGYALVAPYVSDRKVSETDLVLDSIPSSAAKEEKLVLPAQSSYTDAESSISTGQTLIQRPSRPFNTPKRGAISTIHLHDVPNSRNSFMVASLMGISFMLIIMSTILFAVFSYSSNREAQRIRTLTAQAISTNQANSPVGKQSKGTSMTKTGVPRLSPQQVPLATANAITGSAPAIQDDLSTDFIGGWYVDNTSCTFVGGTYRVIVKQANFLQTCESSIFSFDNAALQVDVSLLSGSDAGLIFRANSQQYYDFGINNQGEYFFLRHDSDGSGGGSITDLVPGTKSSVIAPGKKKNTLLVIANGSDFKLFINRIFVGELQDSSYRGGQVGFGVGTLSSVNTGEASFSNFKEYPVSS